MNKKKYLTICATTATNDYTRVRTSVPEILARTCTHGREIGTGIYLMGIHRGRRWGIVKMLNIWVKPDGTTHGHQYRAYDLENNAEANSFEDLCNDVSPIYQY